MKKLSICISAFNEESNLAPLLKELSSISIDDVDISYLIIDDGSEDNSYDVFKKMIIEYPKLSIVRLTRNFGHEAAMTAGAIHSRDSDAVIFMDADLQHPPKLIPKMVDLWLAGNPIVLTKRLSNKDETMLYKFLKSIFNKIMLSLSKDLYNPNTPDFRLIDKEHLALLNKYSESSRLFRSLINLIVKTNKVPFVEFDAPERLYGESKYGFVKSISLAIDAIVAFTYQPIRIALAASISLFLSACVYAIYIFYGFFTGAYDIPGFATVTLLILILGSFNLMLTSLIGEYIARIHLEVKKRPMFHIKEILGNDRDD
jgi:polyisoprenyl-phosphate glycosyltransferase